MDIIPVGTKVSIRDTHLGKTSRERYYGYVRKVEVTEMTRYFVQFHPALEHRVYRPADLSIED